MRREEAQPSDGAEEKGEQIKEGHKKWGLGQGRRRKSEAKGAEWEMQKERKDEIIVELQRDASCLSPLALSPHRLFWCLPHHRWSKLSAGCRGMAKQAKSHKEKGEK